MALKDTDYDMVSAAMADRVAKFVPPEMGECIRCSLPCKAAHLEKSICPECREGMEE